MMPLASRDDFVALLAELKSKDDNGESLKVLQRSLILLSQAVESTRQARSCAASGDVAGMAGVWNASACADLRNGWQHLVIATGEFYETAPKPSKNTIQDETAPKPSRNTIQDECRAALGLLGHNKSIRATTVSERALAALGGRGLITVENGMVRARMTALGYCADTSTFEL